MNNATKPTSLTFWSLKGLPGHLLWGRILFLSMILLSLLIMSVCLINAVQWIDRPFAGFLLNERMIAGHSGQYHWTGIQAGLKSSDKILKAGDRDVATMRDLDQIVSSNKEGTPITYTIRRQGETRELTIPTMRFNVTDLFTIFGVFFIMGVLYLITGMVVFILKPDTKVSWIFLVSCFLLGISSIISFDTESTHFGFVRVIMFVDAFLPAFVLNLSLLFPEKTRLVERFPYLQVVPYVFSTVLFILLELLYPNPQFISVYKVLLVYLNVSVILFIASIIHSLFRRSSTLARQRAKVILFGALLALPVPAAAPLAAYLGGTVGGLKIITNLSAIPSVIFPMAIAYAIAKHNLFDVDVYIKRAVGYAIMTAIVGSIYFALQIFVKNYILSPVFGDYAEKIYPLLFAVLVVFLFNPVNQNVQGLVEKLFYRKKFDYKETVLSVSNALTSVLNIDEILKRIINTLRQEMFIDRAGVILLEPRKECRTLFITDEPESRNDQITDECLPADDPLVALVSREKKLVTKYDIAESPRYSAVRASCGRRFSDMKASLTIPLMYQEEVTGVLALGYKKSGHFYSREDIHLLETLANQGAVAIENAKRAEQMKKEEAVRTNLARYLSPQIVEQVINKNVEVNLGGDRKVVTVLFSDIRNFTTITETRPADQLVQILNEYFTEMAQIIFDNNGSLDKYIGDAIVAVFGSLILTENPAESAVRAGIQMMQHMPALNEKWMREYGFSMQMGIGITTGEVFLGNVGSPERMEFTVIGDTVNIASRFSGLARAGQILITRATLDCIGDGEIRFKELPPAEVKGKTGRLDVFEVCVD